MAQNPPNAFPHLQKNILGTLSKVFFSRNLDRPECDASCRDERASEAVYKFLSFSLKIAPYIQSGGKRRLTYHFLTLSMLYLHPRPIKTRA